MTSRLSAGALAATTAAVLAFMIIPVIFVAWSAFYASPFLSFPPPGYTTRWFHAALSRDAFLNGIVTSFKVALAASAAGVIIGTMASLVIARGRFPGRDALAALLVAHGSAHKEFRIGGMGEAPGCLRRFGKITHVSDP